jgi:hypothetical protein
LVHLLCSARSLKLFSLLLQRIRHASIFRPRLRGVLAICATYFYCWNTPSGSNSAQFNRYFYFKFFLPFFIVYDFAPQRGGDFSTRDFLQSHEARIKGLNFFQSCWDESVDVTYTQTLGPLYFGSAISYALIWVSKGLLKPPVYEPKSRYPGKVKRRRYMPKPKEPQYKKTLLRDK